MHLVLVLLVTFQATLYVERVQSTPMTSIVYDIVLKSLSSLEDIFARQPEVALTQGEQTHLQLNENAIVPFKKVISSSSEQLVDGVFTCKTPGYYKFQFYSLTISDKMLFLEVSLNSDRVANLWARLPGRYAGAGNAIVLKLKQGDTVKVDSRRTSDMFGKPNEIYTTFTGVQLEMTSQGSSPPVAFSAVVTAHQNIPAGGTVKYDTVQMDTKNAYDKNTGIYTVPASGIYVFHFFSLASRGKKVSQRFYRNTENVCTIHGEMKTEYAGAGNTVILNLRHGDKIQVKANSEFTNDIYGRPDEIYTSLSGYQLPSEVCLHNTVTKCEPGVFFFVGLSESKTFQNGEKVVFDRVFDHGMVNHYNKLTGKFTAPKKGMYEFNFHALPKKSKPVWLGLFHNDRYIVSIYGLDPNDSAMAGNAAVIDMDVGDVVYVRANGINDLYGLPNEIFCTFSGVLIQTAL